MQEFRFLHLAWISHGPRPQPGARNLTSIVAPRAPANSKPTRARPEDVIPLDADDLADF